MTKVSASRARIDESFAGPPVGLICLNLLSTRVTKIFHVSWAMSAALAFSAQRLCASARGGGAAVCC